MTADPLSGEAVEALWKEPMTQARAEEKVTIINACGTLRRLLEYPKPGVWELIDRELKAFFATYYEDKGRKAATDERRQIEKAIALIEDGAGAYEENEDRERADLLFWAAKQVRIALKQSVIAVLADPQAAADALPQDERDSYDEAQRSVLEARGFIPTALAAAEDKGRSEERERLGREYRVNAPDGIYGPFPDRQAALMELGEHYADWEENGGPRPPELESRSVGPWVEGASLDSDQEATR